MQTDLLTKPSLTAMVTDVLPKAGTVHYQISPELVSLQDLIERAARLTRDQQLIFTHVGEYETAEELSLALGISRARVNQSLRELIRGKWLTDWKLGISKEGVS